VKELERSLSDAAVSSFRDSFTGQITLPGDEGYEQARLVWNGIPDKHPAIVVRPESTDDVVAALRFGREQDLLIAVRSGGHSVAGFSTCDGGMVIDLRSMNRVEVDPERRVARVQGGSLLSQLDTAAQAFGLACPVGVVGHTGIGGLTLGGGMGRLMRRHGLTVDNLLSAELVTADGRQVRASHDENADLFWGMRGAGANFGIVTSFELGLHEVGPNVVAGMVAHPIERAHEIASLYRDLAESAPDDVFPALYFTVALPEEEFPPEIAGRPMIAIALTHFGPADEAERYVQAVRGDGAIVDTFKMMTYLDVQAVNDEPMAWGHRFYMKGALLPDVNPGFVDTAAEAVARVPGQCELSLWALGGTVSRVPDDAMAFTGRDAEFWLGVESLWDDPARDDEVVGWSRSTMASLEPFTTAGHYVNDMVETGTDVVRSVYGDAKYEFLVDLKRQWDPENVFRLNQNVQP
jgi:FAD binding domain/Berberine and berberine like